MARAAAMPAMRTLALAAVLSALAPAPAALAYKCKVSESYSYVSLSWTNRAIKYGIREGPSTIDPLTAVDAIDQAFTAWTQPECTDVSFENVGVVSSDQTNVSQVIFVEDDWKYEPSALALTRTRYGVEDGTIHSATIEVNEQLFRFADVVKEGCPPSPQTYDIVSVLTHEVGHLIGLDHPLPGHFTPGPNEPTMAPTVDTCKTDKRTLEQDDIDGLCTLYPKGEPPGHCETLPQTSGTYVSNTPFGCTALPDSGDASAWASLALLGLLALRIAPRRRSKTCPEVRSG